MASWPQSAARWVRGLLGRHRTAPPSFTGTTNGIATGEDAALQAELLISEALVHLALTDDIDPMRPEARLGSGPTNAFGNRVAVSLVVEARGAVAAASGLTLSGLRSAAFMPGEHVAAAHDEISAAVHRRLPLVIHVANQALAQHTVGLGSGHESYHALADTGAMLFFARNGQEALDLTLLARYVAELALTPAIVAIDGPELARAPQDFRLLGSELVSAFLGAPSAVIDTPTAAQQMLFGNRRRRIPKWFDLDRPTAHGVTLSGPDLAVAMAGQEIFFADHVSELLNDAMESLSGLTGRPLAPLFRFGLDNAQHVLVAQGSGVETAQAVAKKLRESGERVGVIGVTCLRPFPSEAIRSALAKAESVTVLERASDGLATGGPLTRELAAALRSDRPRLLTATYGLGGQGVSAAQVAAVYKNMKAGASARPAIHLGVAPPTIKSRYPKREVLLQRVKRSYPELAEHTLDDGEPFDARVADARTVSLYHREAHDAGRLISALADGLAESVGPHIRSRSVIVDETGWIGTVTGALTPFDDPGDDAPADIVLIASLDLPGDTNPMANLVQGGVVACASSLEPEELWSAFPATWRAAIGKADATLYAFDVSAGELIEKVAGLFGDTNDESEAPEPINTRSLPESSDDGESELPLIVRRSDKMDETYDNIPRFWGEVWQPRHGELSAGPVPDPYMSLGLVPPNTSTFHDASAERNQIPAIDGALCTGCGDCWTDCPHSALAATAFGTEALLNAAADMAAKPDSPADPAAGKLQRAHKQLAARIDGQLAKADDGTLSADLLTASFEWLTDKMKVGDDERPAMTTAFKATVGALEPLSVWTTDLFFNGPHSQQKGSGELLTLAVSPQACVGCGICAAVCPEEAISLAPQSTDDVVQLRQTWSAWERLPDTSGSTIARVGALPDFSELSAVLMSRHSLFAVAGGDGAEPGSGERLALRQIAAVVEYQMQRQLAAQFQDVDKMVASARNAVRDAMAEAVPVDDLGLLDEALSAAPGRGSSLAKVLSHLDKLGEKSNIDSRAVQRLIRATRELERTRWQLAEGQQNLGRARFGLVVAGESAADWAALFPRNPFSVPLVADLSGNGPDLALGLIEGLLAERLEEARLIRHTQLLLDNPSDLIVKERALADLTWRDLTADELALCPSVLVLCGPEALSGRDLVGLSRLLASDVPAKVVVLDNHGPLSDTPTPLLLALAHRNAFVLSTSAAYPDHLIDGVSAALAYAGPALIHMYAPSPAGHGFSTDVAMARAEMAVESRVQPLFRYDPTVPGVFGKRISLAGNPDLKSAFASDEDGAALTPAHWATGEIRYAALFDEQVEGPAAPIAEWAQLPADQRAGKTPVIDGPDEKQVAVDPALANAVVARLENWATLQELAGIVTPFTDDVRTDVETELAAGHSAEIAALRAEYEAKMAELEASQQAEQASRLRSRLLQLAGYGATGAAHSGSKGEA